MKLDLSFTSRSSAHFINLLPESTLPLCQSTSKQFPERSLRPKIDSPPGGARARYTTPGVHLPLSAFRYKRPTNAAITTSSLGAGLTGIDLYCPKYRLASRLHAVPL